jgi:hypothetical protein
LTGSLISGWREDMAWAPKAGSAKVNNASENLETENLLAMKDPL